MNDNEKPGKGTQYQAVPFTPMRKNDVRAIICLAASATVLATYNWSDLQIATLIVITLSVIYTIASFILLRKISRKKYPEVFDQITTFDAAMIGFVLSFVQFTVLPTLLFILMIQFNSIINGGAVKWIKDNVAFLCGIGLTFLFWQPQWTFSSDLSIGIASFIGIFTYFCSYAMLLHAHIKRLELNTEKLANEQVLYKLRTYKLSRYLTPSVWKAVNEGREQTLKTDRKRITVFFSDIQGFSSLSEELESESITALLNQYLTEMTKIVAHYKGNIDKFMGDGLMVLFGDSHSDGIKDDAVRSVSMAIQMRKKMRELQTKWYNQGVKKPLQIRMGINSGYCTVGTFGTSHYMDYTVLGTHVNLASRLESAAKAGEILVSHETWSLVKDVVMCRDKGEISVKGFSHPIKVYQVVDFRKDLGKNQSYFEESTEGFSMHLDLEKIRNYDKQRILSTLEGIIDRVRDKIL